MSQPDFDFAEVLRQMVEARASDVHLTAGFPPAIRDKGKIVPMEGFPVLGGQETREVIYGILNDEQRKRFENNKQLDFAYAIPGVARFRVNCFFQRGSVSAAFRLVPQDIPGLDTLGVPQVLRELTNKPRGFVLVTGPTGSGKSTTLAAMIDVINAGNQDHILTIEDPIEFLHAHKRSIVNQREIGSDAPDFALGLRAALREDPDVILVGEMRDLETISTALTAARPATWFSPPFTPSPPHKRWTASSTSFHPPSRTRCEPSYRSHCRGLSPNNCCRLPTAGVGSWPVRC